MSAEHLKFYTSERQGEQARGVIVIYTWTTLSFQDISKMRLTIVISLY
jgi:hypothetical protein